MPFDGASYFGKPEPLPSGKRAWLIEVLKEMVWSAGMLLTGTCINVLISSLLGAGTIAGDWIGTAGFLGFLGWAIRQRVRRETTELFGDPSEI